ncbi:MAG: NAD(P)-dependent oxidoreductase [Bacteroidales bacterium]|nr:NAD(P)-dependent oxidoreductase [Bacteroidales bacterium]
MKKLLIIGGLGFIGYHIAKRFLKEKYFVVCVDALKNYININYKTWNYYINIRQSDLKSHGAVIYVRDINKQPIDDIILQHQIQYIINTASMPVALLCELSADVAKNDIFDSNFNILETLKKFSTSISKYIYISSSMVYGNFKKDEKGNIIPPTEDFDCNPIDLYGALKLSTEILIKQYSYKYNINYVIIRPTSVYGFTDCNLRVIELFVTKALKKQPIELDNEGKHQLDFTYVDDLVEGIFLATENDRVVNQIFNISYGEGRTIEELSLLLKQYFPDLVIIKNTKSPTRALRGALNIEKAKKILNYNPHYNLEKGLSLYINMLKQHADVL